MKKTLRITAIILSVVAAIVTHPFLSVSAKEIRPVKMERIQNITGASGVFEGSQISYNYSVIAGQSSTLSQSTLNYPVIYACDIIINLRQPVSTALITFTFTTPSTSNYSLNFIVEHGRVTTFNQNTLTVQCLNTDVVYIKLIFSLRQLMDNYGYPAASAAISDPLSNAWVQSGYSYFQIMSASMASATQYQGEYEAKLTSILSSVDGIEGLLNSILTNTTSLNSNISSISSVMNLLYSLEVNNNTLYKWFKGVDDSLDNQYKIEFSDTDIVATYGRPAFRYSDWIVLPDDTTDYKLLFNTTNTIGDTDLWYFNLPYQFGNTLRTNNIYMYDLDNDAIFRLDIDTQMIDNHRNFRLKLYKLDLTTYSVSQLSDVASNIFQVYCISNDISLNEMMLHTNEKLDMIMELIASINITQTDVTNIVNNYDINIHQVFNIENNINQQLQNEMQNFTPDNTNILQRLNDSSILLKSVLNQINGIEIFTVPIAVVLVGIVLLAIVG